MRFHKLGDAGPLVLRNSIVLGHDFQEFNLCLGMSCLNSIVHKHSWHKSVLPSHMFVWSLHVHSHSLQCDWVLANGIDIEEMV